VLRLLEAADGYLARVRLPGGLVTAAQLRTLARLAGEMGDGRVELTSRGNVQLRALPAGAAARLTGELTAAGLLPSLDHDRVRNVLASPLAGLDGGTNLAPVVRALDAGLCARPRLAGLSGRFLFAIDDGRGDVAGLGADVIAVVRDGEGSVNGLRVTGPGDQPDEVAAVMLAFAEAFLDVRDTEVATPGVPREGYWRISNLADGPRRVRFTVVKRLGLDTAPEADLSWLAGYPGKTKAAAATPPARPVGTVGDHVVLLAQLGRLTVTHLEWLAHRLTGRAARVTPWRSVVLPSQDNPAEALREAAALGFGVDASSPWLRVTACAGKPGCAKALADVQADAAAFAARWPGRIVHVSGCGRHCGRPAATEIDVTATTEGYQVAGV
jgi:precorrin-3B synthase